MNDWIFHSELSHLVLIPQHAKTVVPANHLAARGYLVHEDFLLGCAYSTAGRDKVYDQGKRILSTTLDGSHRDDRLRSMGLFWTTKARFQS